MVTLQAGLACLLAATLFVSSSASEVDYTSAVVESCQGCQLNRLPEVKKFIFTDVPEYENVEFKHIQGAPPELVLYNNEREVERIKLDKMNRQELNDLLKEKGFYRKQEDKDEF